MASTVDSTPTRSSGRITRRSERWRGLFGAEAEVRCDADTWLGGACPSATCAGVGSCMDGRASSYSPWKAVCKAQGYKLVPSPRVLADVALPDGSDAANLRSEPALAEGRVYVGTSGGHVYALWPQ